MEEVDPEFLYNTAIISVTTNSKKKEKITAQWFSDYGISGRIVYGFSQHFVLCLETFPAQPFPSESGSRHQHEHDVH